MLIIAIFKWEGGRAAQQYSGGMVTEAGLLCLCSPVTWFS